MTDKQRTCGDCAWYRNYECDAPIAIDVIDVRKINHNTDSTACKVFRSPADQALIDECHRLRSLGAAVEWAKIDRLVEIAAGRELESKKRCEHCNGIGVFVEKFSDAMTSRHDCLRCHGTGYQKGGE